MRHRHAHVRAAMLLLTAAAWGLSGCAPPPSSPAVAPSAPAVAPPPPAEVAGAPPPAQAFAAVDPEYHFADPDRRKKLASAFPAIDALVEAEVRDKKLPSVALGVVIDGELVHVKGAGFADLERKTVPDADTIYRIGSITKSFTALAVLSLRDEGALGLDDPLVRWLPEAAGLVYPTRDARPITLRQLMTHTSGLPRTGMFDDTQPDKPPSEGQVLGSLAGLALENPPGTRFVYSNLGFSLLGLVVARASHSSIRAVVGAKILGPLGMTSTGWDEPKDQGGRLSTPYKKSATGALEAIVNQRFGDSEAAGGIYSTVSDLARYAAFQLAAYPPRSEPEGAVRRSTVRETHESALAVGLDIGLERGAALGQPAVAVSAASYGFGWNVERTCDFDDLVSHKGSVEGNMAAVFFLPQHGVAVVSLTNFREPDFPFGALGRQVLGALQKTGGLAKLVKLERPATSFGPAIESLLAVYEHWDPERYQAMLTPGRRVKPEDERAELADYRALHGVCKGSRLLEATGPFHGRFAFDCERGRLEMSVQLNPVDGKIQGFSGTSHDVPAPAPLARAADRLAGLIGKWDDRLYDTMLGANTHRTKAERKATFAEHKAAHGVCKVRSFTLHRGRGRQAATLSCERGGDLALHLEVDEKIPERVPDFWLGAAGTGGTCPVR